MGKGEDGERVGGGVDELRRKVHRFFGKEEEFSRKVVGLPLVLAPSFCAVVADWGKMDGGTKKTPRIPKNGGVCASSRLALFVRGLRVSVGSSEGSSRATHAFRSGGLRHTEIDGAKFLFVLNYVVLEGEEETLRTLGREDLAGIYASLGQTGKSGDEVEHELLRAVVDDGQIAVSAVGDFGSELDLELLTLFFFVCHERVVCYVDE